ncbi:uncharacterized protein LOC144544045 [Carex rostrata]
MANFMMMQSVLEKVKLESDGSNFVDWLHILIMVLEKDNKDYIVKTLPKVPNGTNKDEVSKYLEYIQDDLKVSNLILTTINTELQNQLKGGSAYGIVNELKKIFQEQVRVGKCIVTKDLMNCRVSENDSLSDHLDKMFSCLEQLENLDSPVDEELAKSIMISSFPPCYNRYVANLMKMELSLTDLYELLKDAEFDMKHPEFDMKFPTEEEKENDKKAERKRRAKKWVKNI